MFVLTNNTDPAISSNNFDLGQQNSPKCNNDDKNKKNTKSNKEDVKEDDGSNYHQNTNLRFVINKIIPMARNLFACKQIHNTTNCCFRISSYQSTIWMDYI